MGFAGTALAGAAGVADGAGEAGDAAGVELAEGEGVGAGVGLNHAAGQRTKISVAVWPARAFSMLAAGVKVPVFASNSSVLASGL